MLSPIITYLDSHDLAQHLLHPQDIDMLLHSRRPLTRAASLRLPPFPSHWLPYLVDRLKRDWRCRIEDLDSGSGDCMALRVCVLTVHIALVLLLHWNSGGGRRRDFIKLSNVRADARVGPKAHLAVEAFKAHWTCMLAMTYSFKPSLSGRVVWYL